MGKLRSLQNLSALCVGKEKHSGSSIKELGELPHLSGSLCISNLENVYQTRDAKEVNLKDKKGLSELKLKWGSGHENYDSEQERDVLEQLCPHTNLKSLSIISYYGAEYPSWLGACSFSNMVSLKLDDCRYCSSLPPLGQLLALKELSIEGLGRVSCVDSEFYGDGSWETNKPFKSLEILTFKWMPEWKEWFILKAEFSQPSESFALSDVPSLPEEALLPPSLIRLDISFPHLTSLNGKGFQHLTLLKQLEISNCDNLPFYSRYL
nr:putative disease resistance rpp13-like protein 1 [Quercus suber]POE80218.1 putative disease resistance rpp13-like protein 1 [Quercus suber]